MKLTGARRKTAIVPLPRRTLGRDPGRLERWDRGGRRRRRRASGFTLIEIMVVVIVLAIMASLIVPQFVGVTYDAKVEKVRTDIATLQNALERYYLTMDRYPPTEVGLNGLLERPPEGAEFWKGPYIRELPPDPWGSEYQYRSPGLEGRTYDIWSRGADRADGGEEQDADVTSWREKE